MQALSQSVETLVAALACAAFAHFGVALKEPCSKTERDAHRIPISAPAPIRTDPPAARSGFPRDIRRT